MVMDEIAQERREDVEKESWGVSVLTAGQRKLTGSKWLEKSRGREESVGAGGQAGRSCPRCLGQGLEIRNSHATVTMKLPVTSMEAVLMASPFPVHIFCKV
jgi:hypothetical protein